MNKHLLTEDQVIEGAKNYLLNKGRTKSRRTLGQASAETKQHGIDLHVKLEDAKGQGNNYFIEAKGNLRSDGQEMKTPMNSNFRWAVSQIILKIKVDSTKNNYIYVIAVPDSEASKCLRLMEDTWSLKSLKIRLYGAYRKKDGTLTAREYLPSEIYTKKGRMK